MEKGVKWGKFSIDILIKLLNPGAYSNIPISNFIFWLNKKIKVQIFYGEKDFMDREAFIKLRDDIKEQLDMFL